jgi:hypothetical protein
MDQQVDTTPTSPDVQERYQKCIELKFTAQRLYDRTYQICNSADAVKVGYTLCGRLRDVSWPPLLTVPIDWNAVDAWIETTKALLEEADQAIAAYDRQLKEAEQKLQADTRSLLKILQAQWLNCRLCGLRLNWGPAAAEHAMRRGIVDRKFINRGGQCQCFSFGVNQVPAAQPLVAALAVGIAGNTAHDSGCKANVIYRTSVGDTPLLDVVFTQYGGGVVRLEMIVHRLALGEKGNVHTVQVWKQPSELKIQIAKLKKEQSGYETAVADAESKARHGISIWKLTLTAPKEASSKFAWISTPQKGIACVVSNDDAKLVPFEVVAGKTYYCQKLCDASFCGTSVRIFYVRPFLMADRDFAAEIKVLESQLEKEQAQASSKKS